MGSDPDSLRVATPIASEASGGEIDMLGAALPLYTIVPFAAMLLALALLRL